MSDDPLELPPPPGAEADSWLDRLTAYAESLDLTPARLVVAVAAVVLVAVVGWRLLSTSAAAPSSGVEARLPMVTTSTSSSSPAATTGATAVVVDVVGAVRSAGIQRLRTGARV